MILRDFYPEDFDDVHEYSLDYENVKHMMFGPNTPEQTYQYLNVQCEEEKAAVPRMHYNIAVEVKSIKKVIRVISLHLNWRRDDAVLGVILSRHYSHKCYMTEAMGGVSEIRFTQLQLHHLHAICDVDNVLY